MWDSRPNCLSAVSLGKQIAYPTDAIFYVHLLVTVISHLLKIISKISQSTALIKELRGTMLDQHKRSKMTKLLLVGIAAGIIAIHLSTMLKRGYTDLWGISLFAWTAVCLSIWNKHTNLSLKSNLLPTFLGTVIIFCVLIETTTPINKFLYVSPFISAIGLSLIASGFRGVKQYWQEILLLFFPNAAYVIILFLLDISLLTAKFSTFTLWYLGFPVSRHGVVIDLGTAVIEVNQSCSGLAIILHLCMLAVLFLVTFPTSRSKKVLLPIVASLIGFTVNGVRVTLMAILLSSGNEKNFDYWHTGNGSLIFSITAVLIFSLFCFFMMRLYKPKEESSLKQ